MIATGLSRRPVERARLVRVIPACVALSVGALAHAGQPPAPQPQPATPRNGPAPIAVVSWGIAREFAPAEREAARLLRTFGQLARVTHEHEAQDLWALAGATGLAALTGFVDPEPGLEVRGVLFAQPAGAPAARCWSAVLDIRGRADGGALHGALVDGLSAAAGAGPWQVRARTWPHDMRGAVVAFAQDSAPIEWASADERFIVAFGEGSIERWLAHTQDVLVRPIGPDDAAHAARAGEMLAPATLGVACLVDLNALRAAYPESAGGGEIGRLLAAASLRNARTVSVHAGASRDPAAPGSPVASLVAAWSARSSALGLCDGAAVARASRDDARREGTGCVLPVQWEALVQRAVLASQASLSTWDGLEFDARWSRWRAAHGEALRRVVRSLGNEARALPPEGGPPALPVLEIPLTRGTSADRFARDLDAVISGVPGAAGEPGAMPRRWTWQPSPRVQDVLGVPRGSVVACELVDGAPARLVVRVEAAEPGAAVPLRAE